VAKFSIIRPARDEEFMIAAVGDGIPTRLKKSLIPDDAMRAWKACGRRPRTFHIDRASEPTVKGGSDVVEIAGMTTAHQAVYSNMQLPLPSEMSHCPEVVTLDDDTALPAPATKRQRTAPPRSAGRRRPDFVLTCKCEKGQNRGLLHETGGYSIIAYADREHLGIVANFAEMPATESYTHRLELMIRALKDNPQLELLFHDAACLLDRYVQHENRDREGWDQEGLELARDLRLVVDGFHQPNHVDVGCREYYGKDLREHREIWKPVDAVDIICESIFSWLKHFAKSVRRMNKTVADAILVDILDLHNEMVSRGDAKHLAPVAEQTG